MSEGEKKCLLLDYTLRLGKGRDSIVLLDEPDASVHESRKIELLETLKKYAAEGHSVFMTTHSPSIINAAEPEVLFGLQPSYDSGVKRIPRESLMAMSDLTGTRFSFFSPKPILIFEGKSDVLLVKRAVASLRKHDPSYSNLDVDNFFDFYSTGGTGNVRFIYDQFKATVPERLIIIALDADAAGKKALQSLTESSQHHYPKDITDAVPSRIADDVVFLIPKPQGLNSDNWMVEDYLPSSFIIRWMENKIRGFNCFHAVVNLKEALKDYIGNPTDSSFNHEELSGFKPIIDALVEIEKAIA